MRSPFRWAIAVSVAFHAAVAVLVSVLPQGVQMNVPRQRGIEVELVDIRRAPPPSPDAGRQPASRNAPAHPPIVEPDPAEPGSIDPAADEDGPGDMVRADHLMSSDVLADPRSRAARAALAGFGTADQMVQLCGIEAMEQVHAWDARFEPDSVVAYAMAETKISANAVVAEGGAIRSGKQWFNIEYRCELAPDLTRVVAFAFRLGEAIPRSGWEEHNLPDGAEPLE